MSSKLFQRKNFLIKPGYQLKIAITLVLSFIIYSIILALILFYPLAHEFYASVNISRAGDNLQSGTNSPHKALAGHIRCRPFSLACR